MKLLFCEICGSIFNLSYELKECSCGNVKGMYIDQSNAVTNGKGIDIGIGNGSFLDAIYNMKRSTKNPYHLREEYIDIGSVKYCWVRPSDGPGNPHTTVDENLGINE